MGHIQPDTTLPKTPRIRVYTALLTQTGTDAPTAVVLQSTLDGTLVWTRNSVGIYRATLAGTFTENKVWWQIDAINANSQTFSIQPQTIDYTHIISRSGGATTDGLLANTPIEIKIYQ